MKVAPTATWVVALALAAACGLAPLAAQAPEGAIERNVVLGTLSSGKPRRSRTRPRTIRRCFIASLFYNAVAATLAITGWISPLAAAVLMPISSFTVLALAYASRTFEGGR